jgi:hypothetical protein
MKRTTPDKLVVDFGPNGVKKLLKGPWSDPVG